jgi:hypothetical protein
VNITIVNDDRLPPSYAPAIDTNQVAPIIFEDEHDNLIVNSRELTNSLGQLPLINSAT